MVSKLGAQRPGPFGRERVGGGGGGGGDESVGVTSNGLEMGASEAGFPDGNGADCRSYIGIHSLGQTLAHSDPWGGFLPCRVAGGFRRVLHSYGPAAGVAGKTSDNSLVGTLAHRAILPKGYLGRHLNSA